MLAICDTTSRQTSEKIPERFCEMSLGRGQRRGQTLFCKRFLDDLANRLLGLVQKKDGQPGCKAWLCCHDVLPHAGALFSCEMAPFWTYLEAQRQFEEKAWLPFCYFSVCWWKPTLIVPPDARSLRWLHCSWCSFQDSFRGAKRFHFWMVEKI